MRGYKMTMFVPPKSSEAEMWDGPRTGLEGVKELFGADEVNSFSESDVGYACFNHATLTHLIFCRPSNRYASGTVSRTILLLTATFTWTSPPRHRRSSPTR